jgi:hypothetical protein
VEPPKLTQKMQPGSRGGGLEFETTIARG